MAPSAAPPPAAVGSPAATAAARAVSGSGTSWLTVPGATAARAGTLRCGRLNRMYKIAATTMKMRTGKTAVRMAPLAVLSDVTSARIDPGIPASRCG